MSYLFTDWDEAQAQQQIAKTSKQKIKLRPYQLTAVDAVYEEWKMVESTMLNMATGCHAKGEKILAFNGELVSAEDVEVGDMLMGPDSFPRKVLSLHSGIDELFEIKCKGGPTFIVNGNHILHLECTRLRSSGSQSKTLGKVSHVTVNEYLESSKTFKHTRKLKSAAVSFNNGYDDLISAYLYGVLLGDGSIKRHATIVHSQDQEIIDSIAIAVDKGGCKVKVVANKGKSALEYHLMSKERHQHTALKKQLIEYGLAGVSCADKFVPEIIKTGPFEVRLDFLAGILDTDGSLTSKCFDYISKSHKLASDVQFMARSVGLRANLRECLKSSQNGTVGTYFRVTISGDTAIIPCRVLRKIAGARTQIKDSSSYGFTVRKLGLGEYFGFTVSGDHLYLDGNFLIQHNCGKSVVFSDVMRRWDIVTQGKILLIAHRKELILQAIGHAVRAGLSSGIEMADKHATGEEDVIVASVQSLNATRKCRACHGEGCDECFSSGKVKRFTRFNPRDFGLIVCDEFHHFTAISNRNVMTWFSQNPLLKILGVTATPKRADKQGLHNICQSVAYTMGLKQAIDEGWLVPIRQKFVTVEGLDISKVEVRAGKLNEGQVEAAFLGTEEDEERMLHSIVKPTIDEAAGRKTLVFAAGKDHAHKLAACFASNGVEVGVVVEDTDPVERTSLISRYSDGDLQVLINCMVFTEGFDAPATAVIANCRPTKSESLYLQILGRETRPLPGVVDGPETAEERKAAIAASDKPFAVLLDFVGNSGDIKLISVADVLAGDKIDPIDLEEALRVAVKSGETVDIEELAEKAKQSRLEAEQRKEVERRQKLLTNTKADRADYSTVDVDLFGGPEFTSNGEKHVEPITKGQQGFLYHQLGMTRKQTKNMSKRQASAIIARTYKQAGEDWKRLIKEADNVRSLEQVGKAIKDRKSSDYLLKDERVLDSLRAAYKAREKEIGGA